MNDAFFVLLMKWDALGFPHNIWVSCAYDTESYRNAAFTQKNGIAASLMDYVVSTI
jgi:hypothetical protein